MPRSHCLVENHLEGISGQVLDDYPQIVRDLIRGKSGLYVLYKGQSFYYVGLAVDLMRRIKQHLKDRHNGKWDRFSVYLTRRDEHMKELESLVLRIVAPRGNRKGGRFIGSENLGRTLQAQMKESDKARRSKIMGSGAPGLPKQRAKKKVTSSRTTKKRSRKSNKSLRGAAAAAGLFPKAITLRAWYKGHQYRARLLTNGIVRYDGQDYASPTAAAKKIAKGATNGWRFWHFKDASGDWVRLGSAR